MIQQGALLACNLLSRAGRVVARVTGPFMPIQSAFTHQASAEAPAARSRAGQTQAREGGEVFALPQAETVVPGEGAEPVDAAAKVRAQPDASRTVAVSVTQTGKPGPQAAKPDASGIALLIAIAAAGTGARAEAAGEEPATEAGAVAGEIREGETGKDGKATVEDTGEAALTAAAVAAESPAVAAAAPVMVLSQGAPIVGDAAEAVPAGEGARLDAARPAPAAATAGLPLVAIPAPTPAQPGIVAAAEDKDEQGSVQAAKAAGQGLQGFADAMAKAERSAAANGAQAPVEAKALEAQQPAAPFDLASLLQHGSGRPGHDRLLQPFDPNAATGTAPGPAGQGASSGQPTPIHVVPIEIGLRAMSGSRQFDIRLDPGELGRVDVNLSISDTGEVSARLVVDRVETLHLLQRDARTLERAFEQAGLKPSDGGVDISLRDPSDQSAFRQNRQQDEAPQRPRLPNGPELGEEAPLSIDPVPQRRLIRLGGVDLSI